MEKTMITAIIVAIVSFIMQKTLANLIYGIAVFFARPFKKGDKIIIRSHNAELASGNVMSIGPLYVKIKEYNRDVRIIPNSLLESCVLINSDYKDGVNYTSRVMLTLDSDIQKAKEIILETLVQNKNTQNTEENTHLIVKLEDGGAVIEYNVRTEDVISSFDTCSDITEELIKKFRNCKEDIKPF